MTGTPAGTGWLHMGQTGSCCCLGHIDDAGAYIENEVLTIRISTIPTRAVGSAGPCWLHASLDLLPGVPGSEEERRVLTQLNPHLVPFPRLNGELPHGDFVEGPLNADATPGEQRELGTARIGVTDRQIQL